MATSRTASAEEIWPLFNQTFVIEGRTQVPDELLEAKNKLRLSSLSNDIGLLELRRF